MRKIIALTLLIGLLLILLMACGTGASEPDESSKAYNIALITNDSFDPFYLTINRGAQDAAEELGVTVTWQAPGSPDVPSQTSVINSVLASNPDGIITSVVDAQAMVAPLQAIQEAGIPVIVVDTDVVDPSVRLGVIQSDNFAGGKLAADTIADLLDGEGKVGYEGYQPGIQSVDDRFNGWKEGIAQYPGLIDVGEEYDQGEVSQAAASTNAILSRHPDLSGMFGSWTNATIGIANAVQDAEKVDQVKIVGFDAAPDEVSLLSRGVVSALIVQKAYSMGDLSVNYMVDYLENGTMPPPKVLLDFVVATPDNMDSPDVAPFLYGAEQNQ
jgi:ribose transport system substrate-binding protein